MKLTFLKNIFLASAALLACAASPAFAQAPLEPAQMPARTVFYMVWRGAPAPEVRKANSLLALWDDPDFVQVRSALATTMLNSSKDNSSKEKLTPEEMQEYASLLENAFTFGYLSDPVKHAVATTPAAKDAKPPVWNGMFFVYDRSGKETLIAKALLRMRAQEKEASELSTITIAGVPVIKATAKNTTTYWADHGKFAISTGERGVMEEILARLDGKSSAASLAQSPAYREAQPILGSGVLEFFVGIPDLKELASGPSAGTFKPGPLLDAARIDSIHAIGGHLTLEGAKTHIQAAIFGDATSGTPFDMWPAGQAAPASLALVPANAVSYSAVEFDFQGLYGIVKRVARAAFPQAQQGNVDMIEALAQPRLGMSISDALGVFSGEFSSVQTSPSLDPAKQIYFFGINKKPEALKLMRTVLGEQLASERSEGDVTFVKISLGGKQGNAGVAQWNFFHLAVTPDMIFGATRLETLREALASRGKTTGAAGFAAMPQFQAIRAKFPENLNGIGYFDFQKVDWQALKDRLTEESRKRSETKIPGTSKKPASSSTPDLNWLLQANPQVFPRHLHYSAGVSWKDAQGIHWDQWLE